MVALVLDGLVGSRPACLPLPFICLPVLFICLPSSVLVVGFAAGLSPTSFHLSPTFFICLPALFICLPGWVLVVGFPAGLSPTSFHLSPTSFHLSSNSFHSPNSLLLGVLNALKNGRLGAGWSGRVPSRLVSHFLCLPVLFSRGSRLACLPLPFICLPILFICLRHYFLSFVSHFFSLSPRLGACGRVPGRLVSHFLSFVSHFFSFPKQFTVRGSQCFKEWSPWCWMVWSGSRPACLPLPFICLPVLFICLQSSVLVVGFAAGLSPTSFHLSPTSFHLSPSSFHLSPRLGACGRVPGWLVSHFLSFVSHFFSFVPQTGLPVRGSYSF